MTSTTTRLLALLAVAFAAVAFVGCGGDDEAERPSAGGGAEHEAAGHSGTTSAGAAVDRAFAQAMIPHHESAIEMASIAEERATSTFVKELAAEIIAAQDAEIATLKRIDEELEGKGVEPGNLGVPEHMQGMDDDPEELRTADRFDRAFVDMMIPHHEGAIEMAKVELAKGEDAELKRLAQAIIDAQQREIAEMNEFRTKEYGSPAPTSTDDASNSSGQNKAHKVPEEE